jgi:hypothetical protein
MSKIKQLVVDELHKPTRKNYGRRKTKIKGFDDLWQADLAEFGHYSKENKGHKFILIVIDCFSKFLWTVPLKDKSGETVSRGMEKVFSSGRIPKNLQTDHGKEFYNKHFDKLMKKHGVNHYSTYSTVKASMAERVIRTLKGKVYKHFSIIGKYNWYNALPNITKTYNETKHRIIGMKPCDVTIKHDFLKNIYNYPKEVPIKNKFKVNDIVRISKQKAIFDKSYFINWTPELFRIRKINSSYPVTYLLEDIQGQEIKGSFYNEELQKARFEDVYLVEKILRKKGKKVFVKWLGFDKSHNSWIDKNNII